MTIGRTKKPFAIDTDLLTSQSPYFCRLVATLPSHGCYTPISFPNFDEFSFALFVRWLGGEQLTGPTEFHTLQHYIGLYCLSRGFETESLANITMDLIRKYYRQQDMTAPPFRLTFAFKNTYGPCALRNFLVATAAYRMLRQGSLSQVMTDLVEAGGELAASLMGMTLRLHVEGMWDPRTSSECVWHEHKSTPKCGDQEKELVEEEFSRMTMDGN
jgi:hypothetical protein